MELKSKSSVGISGITPFKQDDIQHLLSKQIGNAVGVWRKYHGSCFYNNEQQNCFIDCTSGDMDLNLKTSPLTFITTLRKFSYYPSKLFLIEKNRQTFKKLQKNFQILNIKTGYNSTPSLFRDDYDLNNIDGEVCKVPPEIKLINMNMQDFLVTLTPNKYRFGLLYFDPNGFTKEDYGAIFDFLSKNERMDVILNICATQIKRNRSVKKLEGFNKYNELDLRTVINEVNKYKKVIYIRNNIALEMLHKPICTNKYILLFGTNNRNFVMPGTYNFVPLLSETSREIINKYNYTQNERNTI